eukprot:TRINITY_DN6027_c0_g1_i1.p1 TRINITY_DN6027_c0_g1~~TRINITY_DN6027_c0_g1_i1.p1  ORF type:complete len:387 (+),score=44.92 TRINITY_DN6027_c0_g1_i1:223-1383(+)
MVFRCPNGRRSVDFSQFHLTVPVAVKPIAFPFPPSLGLDGKQQKIRSVPSILQTPQALGAPDGALKAPGEKPKKASAQGAYTDGGVGGLAQQNLPSSSGSRRRQRPSPGLSSGTNSGLRPGNSTSTGLGIATGNGPSANPRVNPDAAGPIPASTPTMLESSLPNSVAKETTNASPGRPRLSGRLSAELTTAALAPESSESGVEGLPLPLPDTHFVRSRSGRRSRGEPRPEKSHRLRKSMRDEGEEEEVEEAEEAAREASARERITRGGPARGGEESAGEREAGDLALPLPIPLRSTADECSKAAQLLLSNASTVNSAFQQLEMECLYQESRSLERTRHWRQLLVELASRIQQCPDLRASDRGENEASLLECAREALEQALAAEEGG